MSLANLAKRIPKACFGVLLSVLMFAASPLAVVLAAPNDLKVDKNHSTVGFRIGIMNGLSEVTGKFSDFDIALAWDAADPTRSTVKAEIKAASIKTGIDARDADLRTAAFFDAEKFPTLTFQSKSVAKKDGHYLVTGDFTMHGVTKEVTLDVLPTGEVKSPKDILRGFKATLRLNRTDFGMKWKHSAVPDYVSDFVEVEINIIAREALSPPKTP